MDTSDSDLSFSQSEKELQHFFFQKKKTLNIIIILYGCVYVCVSWNFITIYCVYIICTAIRGVCVCVLRKYKLFIYVKCNTMLIHV